MSDQSHPRQATKVKPLEAISQREHDFREDSVDGGAIAEGESLSNEKLRQLAGKHHPPAKWFADEEEDLF